MRTTEKQQIHIDMRRYAGGLVEYDATRKRVWLGGQRMHHGMTGALVAGASLAGLVAQRLSPKGGIEWALLGTALMAHDWHDRTHWFELGPQSED